MSTKVVLGADPDLHSTSLCLVEAATGNPLAVQCVKSAKGLKGRAAVVSTIKALQGCVRSMLVALDEPQLIAACVESQEIAYSSKTGANPRDLMMLANISGCLLAESGYETPNLLLPAPADWKGQVPKQIHQARIYGKMLWDYEKIGKDPKKGYSRPTNVPTDLVVVGELNKADWKHVGDAIGLAQWCVGMIKGVKG